MTGDNNTPGGHAGRGLSTSLRRNGRMCQEEVPCWSTVQSVGDASRPMAGEASDPVQGGVHSAGRVGLVVPGDRDKRLGHPKSRM